MSTILGPLNLQSSRLSKITKAIMTLDVYDKLDAQSVYFGIQQSQTPLRQHLSEAGTPWRIQQHIIHTVKSYLSKALFWSCHSSYKSKVLVYSVKLMLLPLLILAQLAYPEIDLNKSLALCKV
ncbi:hypothetical protein IFR04_005557 [Cadophora malorum]|uniref:Uncharacterized protein n=1 Tax=Cadophora malorum TaxID=108018 RepID=A0A8H7W8M3_9HELO|nr:hypothetical protein IFR04_005557 [Cadophora malorum]